MIALRGKALLPWDIFAIRTAANVMPTMSLHLDMSLIYAILGLIVMIAITFMCRHAKPYPYARISATIICSVFIIFAVVSLSYNDTKLTSDPWFSVHASQENGLMVNLIKNTKLLINPAPEGYDSAKVAEIVGTSQSKATKTPDIIVIMDESFSDLSMISNLQMQKDPIAFIHNLKENTIKGTSLVSVFGGGTCNTEYDFLTGNLSAMLRPGSYPMQQFVTKKTPSLAQTLKNRGYRTVGIHPYYPDGWNRDRAYPLLGFDTFYSKYDFISPEIIREYISDRSSFQKVLEVLDADSSRPSFIFNVTMQNHFAYDIKYDNFKEDAVFPDVSKYPKTRQYISLIRHTDDAIRELIGNLKKRTRPTILLFFGDHLPAIEDEYYDMLRNHANLSDAEFDRLKHTVPFFIWANFPIKAQKNVKLSTNFLSSLLLDVAGVAKSDYQSYLFKLMQKCPIISGSENTEAVRNYNYVQYHQVFDSLGQGHSIYQ